MNPSPETLQATEALALCRSRWEQAGLGPAEIDDMLDELRAHLADAAAAGREPAEVLGPRPEQFIQEWARARTPRWERLARRAGLAAAMLLTLLLLNHLLPPSLTAAVTPGFLLYAAGLCAIELFWRPRGRPLTFPRYLVASAALLIPVVLLNRLWPDAVLVRVPLWLTLTLVAVTAAAAIITYRRDAARRSA